MGRFVIVDQREVSGGGIILEAPYAPAESLLEARGAAAAKLRSPEVVWHRTEISADDRALRNGHKGAVLWLTGLSASGKSTLAMELEAELFRHGLNTYVLDGDNVRHGLCGDLGFSPRDRAENIRRIGEVAHLMVDAGLIVITTFISPYRVDRDRVRKILKDNGSEFIEVFVKCPLAVCQQRDPKGLYKKALAGQVKEFTGVSAPYEEPLTPELVLETDRLSVAECVTVIMDYLRELVYVEKHA